MPTEPYEVNHISLHEYFNYLYCVTEPKNLMGSNSIFVGNVYDNLSRTLSNFCYNSVVKVETTIVYFLYTKCDWFCLDIALKFDECICSK